MANLGIVAKSTRFGFPIKNGSVTLVEGKNIVLSLAEERLTRVKYASGCTATINFFLSEILKGSIPDRVIISTCCEPASDATLHDSYLPLLLSHKLTRSPSHHLSHAIASYYLSPFDRALVAVVDAGGNTLPGYEATAKWWEVGREQASFYLGEGSRLHPVHACFTQPFEWGLGEVYRAFTKFTGLGGHVNSGKTMGLAAYGEAGSIEGVLFDCLDGGIIQSRLLMENPDDATSAVSRFLKSCGKEIDARGPDDPITIDYANVAAFVQAELERALEHCLTYLCERLKVSNICLGGGVALNCTANTRISRLGGIDSLFIPPCPGDDGQSLGNALLPCYESAKLDKPNIAFPSAFWGPEHDVSEAEIKSAVKNAGISLEILEDDSNFTRTAQLIAEGQILGWYQGRSEIGPRALGHRSVLGDPRRIETRVRLSHWIKGREPFRPYAASVLDYRCSDWFRLRQPNPYMLLLGGMPDHTLDVAPALYHPDRTCRVQTVSKSNKEFYALIKSFERRTGLPFVVNTSMNGLEEPLVETIREAIELLKKSDLDGIVAGRYILQRQTIGSRRDIVSIPPLAFEPGDPKIERQLRIYYPSYDTSFRYQFGLQRNYCDWILLGRKVTTVRYAAKALDLPASGVLRVVARPGGEAVYAVRIQRFTVRPFGSLSLSDARRDGFDSLFRLKEALKSFYGEIDTVHPITIYDVEPLPGFSSLKGRRIVEPE